MVHRSRTYPDFGGPGADRIARDPSLLDELRSAFLKSLETVRSYVGAELPEADRLRDDRLIQVQNDGVECLNWILRTVDQDSRSVASMILANLFHHWDGHGAPFSLLGTNYANGHEAAWDLLLILVSAANSKDDRRRKLFTLSGTLKAGELHALRARIRDEAARQIRLAEGNPAVQARSGQCRTIPEAPVEETIHRVLSSCTNSKFRLGDDRNPFFSPNAAFLVGAEITGGNLRKRKCELSDADKGRFVQMVGRRNFYSLRVILADEIWRSKITSWLDSKSSKAPQLAQKMVG